MASAPLIEPEPAAAPPIELAAERRENAEASSAAAIIPALRRSDPAQPKAEAKSEPVIPLIHVPDDPGPDIVEESEVPDHRETGGWRKLFG